MEELEKRGARVTVAPVYRTVRADENRGALVSALEAGVDMVTFTASSTVRHFMDLLGGDAAALMRGSGSPASAGSPPTPPAPGACVPM